MSNKIRIEKDNVILSINEEDLAQYEARGYKKMKAQKKENPKKIVKTNEKVIKKDEK